MRVDAVVGFSSPSPEEQHEAHHGTRHLSPASGSGDLVSNLFILIKHLIDAGYVVRGIRSRFMQIYNSFTVLYDTWELFLSKHEHAFYCSLYCQKSFKDDT